MKKLLFIIPTLTGGGAEKVLVNLVNNLDMKKYSITIMTLFNTGENIKYLSSHINYKFFLKKRFRGNKHIFKFFSPRFLYKTIIKDDYDIVISYLEGPTTRIVAGCNNENAKLINWVHNEFNNIDKLSNSYRNIDEVIACYNQFNSTIFVAKTAKQAFQKTLPEVKNDFKVIYNTVETNDIKALSQEILTEVQYDREKINLISVGRFAPQKGYERLLNIVSKLVSKDNLNIHLYLLGKGELEEKYKEIISNNNISENVTFLGYKENPYKYVKNADVFVCSSYREGFSTAVTESLIVGTPVITTMCSGMKEILGEDNEYGIVVNNDEESLYKGLKLLIENKERLDHYKKIAQQRGEDFNTLTTVKKTEEFFDSL